MATATTPRPTEPAEQRGVLRSINPYNGQTLKTFTEISVNELDGAIATAHERFPSWRRLPFGERGTLLREAARLCRERREELAKTMTLDMGKRIVEGRKEVDLCARIFDYYAEHGEEFLRAQTIPSPGGDGTLLNQPLGVILGVEFRMETDRGQALRTAIKACRKGGIVSILGV